jgi:hypothetical protein
MGLDRKTPGGAAEIKVDGDDKRLTIIENASLDSEIIEV